MDEEDNLKLSCSFCGVPTGTFTRCECCRRQVPICECCFMEHYPSPRNLRRVDFWASLCPVISEVKT